MILPRTIGAVVTLRTVYCQCKSIVAVYGDGTLAPHYLSNGPCQAVGESMNDLDFPVAGYVVWNMKTNSVQWFDFAKEQL